MLETGYAIGHSHGAPYIPGSSVKGVVNAHARERFDSEDGGKEIRHELFGASATEAPPAGLSGLLTFHDAWWVPGSAAHPLAPEIVTTHHPEYYGQDGRTPATDFDSPIPNAQIAVHGAFRFVIEGPARDRGPAACCLAGARGGDTGRGVEHPWRRRQDAHGLRPVRNRSRGRSRAAL